MNRIEKFQITDHFINMFCMGKCQITDPPSKVWVSRQNILYEEHRDN